MKQFRSALPVALLLVLALPAGGQQAPSEEKGFQPEKMYSFGSLDSVNTFNGNVVVSIPVGMRYPLDGGLSYGLTLTYNSKVWDFEDLEQHQRAFPSRRANAGMGWLLTMGRLVAPDDPTNSTDAGWLYEAPDGTDHNIVFNTLYSTGAADTGTYADETWYSWDGSFLRMREISPTMRWVESGDGTTSRFELVSGSWRLTHIHNAFTDSAGNPLNYVKVTYPDPPVAACPGTTSVWRLDDSEGRTHYVCFKDQNVGGNDTPTVDRVVLEGPDGGSATYLFEYDLDQEINESCQDTVPNDPQAPFPTFHVPFLRRLKLADGADESCTADDCSRYEFEYFAAGCPTGALKKVTLPTKGGIAYDYDPKTVQANTPCESVPRPPMVGVETRTLLDAAGAAVGVWQYEVQNVPLGDPQDPNSPKPSREFYRSYGPCGHGPGGEPHRPFIYDEAIAWVIDPASNKSLQHYSVWPGNPGHDYDKISKDGFHKNHYSLPIGKLDPATNLHLSGEVFPANCTHAVRRTHVRYRLDPPDKPADAAHRTVEAERTVYQDDACSPAGGASRYAHVEYSDYDGFGHYRKAVTSGSFDGSNARTSETNFNPGANSRGSTASGVLVFSTLDPWILGTYDTVSATEAGQTVTSKYCFDRTTGWLRAVRVGTQDQTNDLVTVFTPEKVNNAPTGNVAAESFYGGDEKKLTDPEASICAMAAAASPGPLGYRLNHTYSYGQRATSQYEGMNFFSLDREIDPSGLIWKTRATDGEVFTQYDYERDGRLRRVAPRGQAATDYAYTRASVSNGVFTPARVKATTSSATAGTVETEYQFDALGRFWREKQRMPDGTWNVRQTVHDALDRKVSVSELEPLPGTGEFSFTPSHTTSFTDYDAFGRAGKITAPDGGETTFSFKGVRETTRTVRIATGGATDTAASTVETYDRHGRLNSVAEPGGVVTRYGYDVGNRLSTVAMGSQLRTFDYDSRGFLRWESHPESGMTSYTYDARGHVLSKSQGAADSLFDLEYVYDGAERLKEIRGRNPHPPGGFRKMKAFDYGTANTGNYLQLGKLTSASRYNYGDPHDWLGETYKVSELYWYGDTAGRKTRRTTLITKGVGTDDEESWETYRQIDVDVTYNDLNLAQVVQYPLCVDCGTPPRQSPVRQQAYSYARGRLASVPGFLDSMTYWPNGMWSTIARSNGMTDTQTADPSGMPRPGSFSAGLSNACTPAKITSDPVGGTVTASSSVTLSIGVSGSGPFTYEWRSSNSDSAVATGATFTATLGNTPVTTQYWVVVTNACKTIESVEATVSVNECIAPEVNASVRPSANDTYTLVAVATGTEPRTYTWRRTSDQTVIGHERTVDLGAVTATTTYSVTVANGCAGSPVTQNVTVTVRSPMQAVLTATRIPNSNQIRVSWTGPTTGVAYTLQRRSGGGWMDLVALSPSALAARSFDDTLPDGKIYAYRLKHDHSQFSNADVATTRMFTRAVAGAFISADAFRPMLDAVNSVRRAVGWPDVTWANILSSKDPLPEPGKLVTSTHITSARARMNEALQALGVPVLPYALGDLQGAYIEAQFLNEVVDRAY